MIKKYKEINHYLSKTKLILFLVYIVYIACPTRSRGGQPSGRTWRSVIMTDLQMTKISFPEKMTTLEGGFYSIIHNGVPSHPLPKADCLQALSPKSPGTS